MYKRQRYYNQSQSDKSDELNESEKWVEIAKQLDGTAKILITFMIEQAVLNSCSEETREWLKTLNGTVNSNEYDFIRMYSAEKKINKTDIRIKNLKSRVSKLETFENLSRQIRQSLLEELKDLEK